MRTNRLVPLGLVVALALVFTLGAVGCQRKVEVQSGERVMCTYGHLISEDVRTVKVSAGEASKYGVKTRTTTCADHLKAQETYRAAQQDLARADLKAAAKKLAVVVAIDATYKKAQSQLDEIAAGKTPTPDESGTSPGGASGTGTEPSTPGGSGLPTGPIASLARWLPADIAGFSAQELTADALFLTRDYWPSSGANSKRLVISVEQMLDAKAVAAALDANVKTPYGEDGRSVEVNRRRGYVGTDGRRTAVLGLTDGSVLVIMQLSSDAGNPSQLADELMTIAKTLPR